jgi:hypothetical protein
VLPRRRATSLVTACVCARAHCCCCACGVARTLLLLLLLCMRRRTHAAAAAVHVTPRTLLPLLLPDCSGRWRRRWLCCGGSAGGACLPRCDGLTHTRARHGVGCWHGAHTRVRVLCTHACVLTAAATAADNTNNHTTTTAKHTGGAEEGRPAGVSRGSALDAAQGGQQEGAGGAQLCSRAPLPMASPAPRRPSPPYLLPRCVGVRACALRAACACAERRVPRHLQRRRHHCGHVWPWGRCGEDTTHAGAWRAPGGEPAGCPLHCVWCRRLACSSMLTTARTPHAHVYAVDDGVPPRPVCVRARAHCAGHGGDDADDAAAHVCRVVHRVRPAGQHPLGLGGCHVAHGVRGHAGGPGGEGWFAALAAAFGANPAPHTTPHHTTPHHTTPHHTTPHHTTPHHTTPHHTTPHHTAPHHTTPRHATPHLTSPHRTAPHRTTPHHATPHHTTPHHTTPHHTTPHHTTPRPCTAPHRLTHA